MTVRVPEPELDRILITGLRVFAHHGVFAHERRDGQPFIIDAEVWLDARAASASDDVTDTVHYGELMQALRDAAAAEPVNLIETLAERLASVCLESPAAAAARITVHKPDAPVPLDFADVAVSVLRHREGAR